MSLVLISDFKDYYDNRFQPAWEHKPGEPAIQRLRSARPPRREIFRRLDRMGLLTPRHGTVRDLAEQWENDNLYLFQVVVYLQDQGGKPNVRVGIREALQRWPRAYASLFIPQEVPGLGHMLRMIKVGREAFWIEYQSRNDWRAEHGANTSRFLGRDHYDLATTVPLPLCQIDFLPRGEGRQRLLAINLDTAPALKGTGIEHFLTPDDVHQLLADATRRQNRALPTRQATADVDVRGLQSGH